MALHSMTGFARVDGGDDRCTWYWEVRTVNAKGFDVRARLPSGFDGLEPKVRQACAGHLKRGNCNANLFLQRDAGATAVTLNETVLSEVIAAAERASELSGMTKPTLESLLSIRGVLDVSEARDDEDQLATRVARILADLKTVLTSLSTARRDEGARLHGGLVLQIDEIERLVTALDATPSRRLEAVRARLQAKVDRLLSDREELDPQRLHQEVVLLATKADIEEELARLVSHVTAARALLASEEPVGRQLDFLSQEFNREANTICSKSNDQIVSQLGMQLKTVIEQFREQVQNIE